MTGHTSLRTLLRGGAGIAVAMVVMNVATYAFTILAARTLGPAEYSAVASLMGLLLVVNVVSLGLQATGARQVAANPGDRDRIEVSVMAATYRSAGGLGLLCLLLTPVIAAVLSLESWPAALMIGVAAVPLTVMGGQAGILQGEHRWVPLAAVYIAMGLGRLLVGGALMVLFGNAFGAMLGVAVAAWLPAAVGAIALGRDATRRGGRAAVHGSVLLREVARNSHALLAFFALGNLDVVMVRAVFTPEEAGLYAGGLILTKAVLFLPQFVVVLAFPSMAQSETRQRVYLKALAIVAVIGVGAMAGAAVLSGLAVTFIGGPAYADIESHLWLFAGLGTLLAMIQLMVYEVVARQRRRSIYLIWAGLVAVAALAPWVDTELSLAIGVAAVYTMVLAVLVAGALLRGRTTGDVARQ